MVRKIPKIAYEQVTTFEALMVAYKMDERDGGMIRLTFYVDDIGNGDWLMNCYPKTPVAIGLKPLDYDNPDQSKVKTEGEKQLARSGMLCRNKKFQRFMEEKSQDDGSYSWGIGRDEAECVKALKKHLNITSRRELLDNYKKIEQFETLTKQFEEWLKWN
jgi:hypothetical protein